MGPLIYRVNAEQTPIFLFKPHIKKMGDFRRPFFSPHVRINALFSASLPGR